MPLSGTIDPDAAYRAVRGRDPRFDGRLYVGVLSTGIYCRPSCPARTPKPENCQFHPTAAACVAAGFRACRRCRPELAPGSRGWDLDADLAHRALRLINDGAVDEHGVAGLARRLALSPRQLHRVLVSRLGASPVQLARTRRAQVARMLLDGTQWPMADVAFAAGFASVRQFNDVMRAEFGAPPTALRPAPRPVATTAATGSTARATGSTARATGSTARATGVTARGTGAPAQARASTARADEPAAGTATPPQRVLGASLTVLLRHAGPYEAAAFLHHAQARAVPGMETVEGSVVRRTVPGRAGPVLVELTVQPHGVSARLDVGALHDVARVVGRLRHWADLDADPLCVGEALVPDPLLAPMVTARPGLRVPGTPDPTELALRTVIGQQVSVRAARTFTARLVAALGEATPFGPRSFPTPAAIAAAGVGGLGDVGLTSARARTLVALAERLHAGLDVGPGCDRHVARSALSDISGIGPWTVEYIALRAMGDPDAFPAGDGVLRKALGGLSAAAALRRAEGWRPWRGYAAQHLWTAAAPPAQHRPEDR